MSDNEATTEDLDLLIGDVPIARYLFRDPRKRRLVPKLKEDGWPIFEMLGKNAARRSSLSAIVAERERQVTES
jgi:hypothetical protein